MQTANTGFVDKNDLDKTCFQHEMAYLNANIWLKEHHLIKFQEIKLFKLEAIQNMMDMKKD